MGHGKKIDNEPVRLKSATGEVVEAREKDPEKYVVRVVKKSSEGKKSKTFGKLVLFIKPYRYKVSESKKSYPHDTLLAQVAMEIADKEKPDKVFFEKRSYHPRDLELVLDESVKEEFLERYKNGEKRKLRDFCCGDVV